MGAAPALAQHTSEVGIGIGATNYKGEISPQLQWQNSRPAFTVFYRYDVSSPVTLRGAFTAGGLRANDSNVEGVNGTPPPLQAYRQASLRGSVYELSGVMEYNFLDYHLRREKGRFHVSPYLFLGVAGYYVSTTTETQNQALKSAFNQDGSKVGIAIPAGAGLKVALSSHLNLGLEMGVRKTFTDELDHLGTQDPLYVNAHDQDWYYYSGLSVSYTFYKILCPPVYGRNKHLLD